MAKEIEAGHPLVALIRKFQGRVFAQVLAILGNVGDAEEAAQETFVRAFEHWKSLRDPAAFPGWIGVIARNVAADRLRTRALLRPAISPEPSDARFPDDPVEGDERAKALWQEVEALEPHYRTAFLLVTLEGLTYGEAADQLEVPLSTLEGRMYKARQILREKLRWL